jgi:MFS family permease
MQSQPISKAKRIGIFLGLCWLYTCIHLDRQILGILAESVKSDLRLSDAALGALTGSAFSIVYALLGLHFGRLADNRDRLALVRIGALIWSLASIGAAFAPNYSWLVVGRAGVAVGEAIATAAAISLMSELAGERYLARASSVFASCAFLGAGLAAIAGGQIVHLFRESAYLGGWRAGLVMAGIPGLIGVVYLHFFRFKDRTTVRKPLTAGAGEIILVLGAALALLVQTSLPPNQGVPIAVLLACAAAGWWASRLRRNDLDSYLASFGNAPFRLLLVAFAAVLFMDFAAFFWLIPFAQRRFGVSVQTVGTQIGALIVVGGIVGSALGGFCADRWRRTSRAGRAWTALIAVLLEASAIFAAILQQHYSAYIVAVGVCCIASGGWTGITAALGLDLVPTQKRGTAIATYFLVTTLLGPGLGAWAAGAFGDVFGLARSLAMCAGIGILSLLAFVRLGRAMIRN